MIYIKLPLLYKCPKELLLMMTTALFYRYVAGKKSLKNEF